MRNALVLLKSTPKPIDESLLALALYASDFEDGLAVLGDRVLQEDWFDPKVTLLFGRQDSQARAYFFRSAARPSKSWARAIAAVLLFGDWSEKRWPLIQRDTENSPRRQTSRPPIYRQYASPEWLRRAPAEENTPIRTLVVDGRSLPVFNAYMTEKSQRLKPSYFPFAHESRVETTLHFSTLRMDVGVLMDAASVEVTIPELGRSGSAIVERYTIDGEQEMTTWELRLFGEI